MKTVLILWLGSFCLFGETFRVATFNVENYLAEATQTRSEKSVEAKAHVHRSILMIHPDVLALQEVGGPAALEELRLSLKTGGLDLPYAEQVAGADTNAHVAILSRFPFAACRPVTNDNFLVNGRRFRVSRGFGRVDIRVSTHYAFTLIAAHLKSKRPVPQASEADLRLEEARLLREVVEGELRANPDLNLIVLGDFNDTKDSPPIRALMGRGRHKLVDICPAEPNSGSGNSPRNGRGAVTWTHYYAREDTYSRIDYILVSPGLAREWLAEGTYVLSWPGWGLASDHRPLVASFEAVDR